MDDELRQAAEEILAGEVVSVHNGFTTVKEFPKAWQELARAYLDGTFVVRTEPLSETYDGTVTHE